MNTPIADIISLADTINDLSIRIAGGLSWDSMYFGYNTPDDAIAAYIELREKMTTMFSYENATALQAFALETNKNWQELEETKNLTPAELGCDYPA